MHVNFVVNLHSRHSNAALLAENDMLERFIRRQHPQLLDCWTVGEDVCAEAMVGFQTRVLYWKYKHTKTPVRVRLNVLVQTGQYNVCVLCVCSSSGSWIWWSPEADIGAKTLHGTDRNITDTKRTGEAQTDIWENPGEPQGWLQHIPACENIANKNNPADVQ